MNSQTRAVLIECTRASDESRMSFPQVVTKLMEAGVERYHADLVRAEKTYHLANGDSETVPNAALSVAPAAEFLATEVESAVHAIQTGNIDYKTFCERVLAAGCVGYLVSMAGRRVIYYGRTGDNHVEWFPGAR